MESETSLNKHVPPRGSLADRSATNPSSSPAAPYVRPVSVTRGVTRPALVVASPRLVRRRLVHPAVRAYLSEDAGERRVQAFALFSVSTNGILLGRCSG